MQPDFDRSVFVLQSQIAGQAFERDILRSRCQVHWSGERIGAQVTGIQIQPAIQPRKFHVRARRAETYRLADANQTGALIELSTQMNRAVHIFHCHFVGSALNGDVALHMLQVGGAFLQGE